MWLLPLRARIPAEPGRPCTEKNLFRTLQVRRWRLIVRNLPFKATEQIISKEFSAAGFVWECRLPRNEKGQSRGFCFVAFTRRDEAEKAIALFTGGSILGRPVAVDWAVAKDRYESAAAGAAAAEEEDADEAAGPSGDSDGDEQPRVRAARWPSALTASACLRV